LEKLQNQVAPAPVSAIKNVIEEELGRSITEAFADFEEEPVAAASLSQVHIARLETGETVALKVQRPNITEDIEADLEILHTLVSLAHQYLLKLGINDPVELVNEFSHNLRRELNFGLEIKNIQRYGDNFQKEAYIHVPCVYPELSTGRLLVMEYIEGLEISETEELQARGYDLSLIARHCADIWLKSTLEHGFFHADPHPGNVFVLPGNIVCLLDYGMMGTVSMSQRERLSWLLYNLSRGDEKRVTRSLLDLAQSSDAVDINVLESKAAGIIADYVSLPLNQLHLGTLLPRLWHLLKEQDLNFDTHLVWLLKAVATGEDIAHRLQADFNMVDYARPYVRRILRYRLSPLRQAREFQMMGIDFLELLKDLPYDTKRALAQLTEGRLKIEFEHLGLEQVRKTLNKITNRLAVAIVLASLIIGSSLIIFSGLPPLVANIPIIGLAGYVVSAIFGLWLVVSIIRS
jgi:ubiquinone biosynthesis protein